jgi:hypothetical protein
VLEPEMNDAERAGLAASASLLQASLAAIA